jgi:hypothetical protein
VLLLVLTFSNVVNTRWGAHATLPACLPLSLFIEGSCTGADGRVGHAARTESCPRPCTATAGPVPTKIIARVRGPGHSPVTVTGPPLIFLFFLREEMIIKTNKGGTSPRQTLHAPTPLTRAAGSSVCLFEPPARRFAFRLLAGWICGFVF